jgi:hypothetical protein
VTDKPSRERIMALLDVEVETGVIRWRESRGRARAGSIAGRTHKHGYREITIDGQQLMAHAIVWLVATGDWAPLLDHHDGVRDHNAYSNLRLADAATNARNRTNWVHRKLLGAFALPNGQFAARITADGRDYELGRFGTEQAAHDQYKTARAAVDLAELRARKKVLEEMTSQRSVA